MPGVVAVLRRLRARAASTPTGATRSRTGRSWRIDRVRFVGEPVAAVAAEDEATAEAALHEIVVEYEELPVVGTIDEAIADDAPLVHDGELRPGALPRARRAARARGQRLLPLPPRRRLGRARRGGGRADGRGRVHVPRRLPVRDGDPHHGRRLRPATSSRSGPPASTRSWSAPRSPTCSSCRSAACGSSCPTSAAASARRPTRRWSRSPRRSPGRRGARCGSRTASTSRW